MLARKVAARLKPNSLATFTGLMEHEILPWLRMQEGFLDLITLAAPDGREVATITFWDDEGNNRDSSSCGYPEALKVLGELLEGTPCAQTFHVANSTFERIAARPAQGDHLVHGAGSGQLRYHPYETGM